MSISDYIAYPVSYTSCADGGYIVTVHGIDDCMTEGKDLQDAENMGRSAIIDMANAYFKDRDLFPSAPKANDGESVIKLSYDTAIKFFIRNLMKVERVTASEIARRLKVTPQNIQKKLDLYKTTKIDFLAEILEALGKKLTISC